MPQDVWTPMITSDPSLRNKSLRSRNKVAHVELLRGLARPVTVIYRNQQRKKQKDFPPSKKRARPKAKKITISNQIPDALRDLHASKYKRPRNKSNDSCL